MEETVCSVFNTAFFFRLGCPAFFFESVRLDSRDFSRERKAARSFLSCILPPCACMVQIPDLLERDLRIFV